MLACPKCGLPPEGCYAEATEKVLMELFSTMCITFSSQSKLKSTEIIQLAGFDVGARFGVGHDLMSDHNVVSV